MYAGVTTTVWPNSATRYRRLNIGGHDFLDTTPSFGIMRESISVDEQGPGGVSSMTFTINDPLVEAQFAVDSLVEFWDITHDRPLFTGFVQNWSIRPTAVGRYIDVTCIGLEALLDWLVVPSLTLKAGLSWAAAIQSLLYNSTGTGFPLNALAVPEPITGDAGYGSQQHTIARIVADFPQLQYDVVIEGTSLREACLQVIVACNTWAGGTGGGYVSVDFYGSLRLFIGNGADERGITTIAPMSDMDSLIIENAMTVGAPVEVSVSDVSFTIDATGVVRGVYVKGANAVGSGLVSDGSGVPGPVSYLVDDTSTTTDIRNQIAADYLGGFSQSVRATATFAPFPAATIDSRNIRPGSYCVYHPDSQVMGEQTFFSVFAIRKTFPSSTLEDWSVDFGGHAPSAQKQTRRLTRDTRS